MTATTKNNRILGRLLAGLVAASTLGLAGTARAAGASVSGQSAMVRVMPTDTVSATSGVGLSAARNEFVSFQVVVQGGDSGASNVSAALSTLTGPGTISGGDIRLYRETYLTTTTPSTPNVATGTYPDGLQPDTDEIANEKRSAFPMNVPAGENRVVWVDVHVPADAAAGVYTGTVSVTGGAAGEVPVTLTVVDAALPSTSTLRTAFRVSSGQVCAAHTGDGDCNGDANLEFALLGKYEQMALEHRITLANIDPRVPADGDWTNTDNWIGAYMDGTAPNRLAGAKMTSVQYQAPEDDVASYAAYAQHYRAKGWFDRAFDYTADEPPYGSTFEGAAAREALVKQADPEFKTLVTTTITQASSNGISGNLDLIVPVVNYLDGDAAPYQGDQSSSYTAFLQGSGKELWNYQSCMSHGCAYGTNDAAGSTESWPSYMVDATFGQGRAMEWSSFAEGATGELYYETAGMLTTAWTNQYQFAGNGDGTLFYPGTSNVIGGSTDVPVASIRLKLVRMGMQDYEWLKLVANAGDGAFAQAVARALVPQASQVVTDGAAYERARLQLIARYLELTGKGAAPSSSGTNTVLGAPPRVATLPPATAILAGVDPVTNRTDATTSAVTSASAAATQADSGGCASGGAELSLLAGLTGLLQLARRRRR